MGLIVQVTLVDTTRLFPSGRQSTALTMFHRSTTDPVDFRITTNSVYNQQTIPNTRQGGGTVLRIDEDDFEVLVNSILVNLV
jgi:hypothetical protein